MFFSERFMPTVMAALLPSNLTSNPTWSRCLLRDATLTRYEVPDTTTPSMLSLLQALRVSRFHRSTLPQSAFETSILGTRPTDLLRCKRGHLLPWVTLSAL